MNNLIPTHAMNAKALSCAGLRVLGIEKITRVGQARTFAAYEIFKTPSDFRVRRMIND